MGALAVMLGFGALAPPGRVELASRLIGLTVLSTLTLVGFVMLLGATDCMASCWPCWATPSFSISSRKAEITTP
jgi:hypothetical protein